MEEKQCRGNGKWGLELHLRQRLQKWFGLWLSRVDPSEGHPLGKVGLTLGKFDQISGAFSQEV